MKNFSILRALLFVFPLIFCSSCSLLLTSMVERNSESSRETSATSSYERQYKSELPKAEIKYRNATPTIVVENEKHLNAWHSYEKIVKQEFDKENFEFLEKLAKGERDGKTRAPGGTWKLERFYNALSIKNEDSFSEEQWKTHLQLFQKWKNEKKESITARVALADALVNYAWKARGSGFANTITEDGARLFHERLSLAKKELLDAKDLQEKCPNWYAVMQTIAMGEGWDRDEYEQLFAEAITLEPTYLPFYSKKATYLLPRWHGEEGEWEDFLEDARVKVGGKEGAVIYFKVCSELMVSYYPKYTFTKTKVSCANLLQGINDLDSLYDLNDARLNEIILFCDLYGDKEFSKKMFQRLGDRWDPSVWKKKEAFDKEKQWAFS